MTLAIQWPAKGALRALSGNRVNRGILERPLRQYVFVFSNHSAATKEIFLPSPVASVAKRIKKAVTVNAPAKDAKTLA